MYARITSVRTAPERLDQGVAAFEQQIVPVLRQQPGYVGAVMDVNRETGEAWGISYWDSLAALNASERESPRRQPGTTALIDASIVDMDRFEIVMFERTASGMVPADRAFVRWNEVYAQPDKVDALTRYMRDSASAVLRQEGCRLMAMGVNRMTGRSFIASVWDTSGHREASEASIAGLRKEAGQIAGAQPVVNLSESAFVEMKQPARTG